MWPAIAVVVLSEKMRRCASIEVVQREAVQQHEAREIGQRRRQHETDRDMIGLEIGPEIGPVPVGLARVGKLRAPALHQPDHGHDDDADGERKQSAPFAGCRKTERTLYDARSVVDRTAARRRAGGGSEADLTAARLALARAQNELSTRQDELRTAEDDGALPTSLEGPPSIARSESAVARSVLDKMTVRAPVDGTVLQVNVRVGEVVSPGSPQPPLQLADLSALCVRAELDERDLGVGQIRASSDGAGGGVSRSRVRGKRPSRSRRWSSPDASSRRDRDAGRNKDVVRVTVGLTGAGKTSRSA